MSRARDIADGKFSGDLEADSPTFVVDSANNRVGIGTSSPLGRLAVQAATGLTGFNTGTSSSPERGNLWYDTDGTGWKFNIGKLQGGTFTPQMTFQDNGTVGIGTSSPAAQLHVANSGGNSTSILGQYGSGTRAEVTAASNEVVIKAYNGTNDVMTFYTGASERMRIDSAGRVTMPYQPAFHAVGNVQLIPSDGQVMPFSIAVTNRGSHYNTSTYRFTAPVSGVYLLAARATWSDNGSGPVPHIAINGAAAGGSTTYTQLFGYTSAGGYNTTSAVAAPISMNAGDYADVRVSIFNSSAGRFDLTRCSFSGYLLG